VAPAACQALTYSTALICLSAQVAQVACSEVSQRLGTGMRRSGCARRARAGPGRLPQYKEQEVSNTLLAFAKAEHVDFALMEARPLPRSPVSGPARRGALHARPVCMPRPLADRALWGVRGPPLGALQARSPPGMASAAFLYPLVQLRRVPDDAIRLSGCIQAAPLQLMCSNVYSAGRERKSMSSSVGAPPCSQFQDPSSLYSCAAPAASCPA